MDVGWSCSAGRMDRVVVGALVRQGRVLLVHRRPDKRAHPDIWDLPGGLVEAGETDLEALARELHEELGVHITTDAVSHVGERIAGPVDEPALLSAWLVPNWQGVPANLAPDEHDDIGWFCVQDLPPSPHVSVRVVLLQAMESHLE